MKTVEENQIAIKKLIDGYPKTPPKERKDIIKVAEELLTASNLLPENDAYRKSGVILAMDTMLYLFQEMKPSDMNRMMANLIDIAKNLDRN